MFLTKALSTLILTLLKNLKMSIARFNNAEEKARAIIAMRAKNLAESKDVEKA